MLPRPKKRGTKVVWKVLFAILLVGLVLLHVLYPKNVLKIVEFSCLTLFGILIAPIIHCLCDVFEECRQCRSRYNRDCSKLLKASFSALPWKPMSIVGVLDVVFLIAMRIRTHADIATLDDLKYIFGGLVFSALVTYLLNLDALSNVSLSRLIEKLGWHPMQTLARSCFCRVERLMPTFTKRFTRGTPVQEQSDAVERNDRDEDTKIQVDSEQIILLVSDCFGTGLPLHDLDNDISEVASNGGCPELPVYRLQYNGREYKLVILCPRDQLAAIKQMHQSKTYEFLYGNNPKDHIDLFCQEISKILAEPGHEFYKHTCTLVPIKEVPNIERGWLVTAIMEKIEADQRTSNNENYTESDTTTPNPIPSRRQPRETSTSSDTTVKSQPCDSRGVAILIGTSSDEDSFLLDRAANENIHNLKRNFKRKVNGRPREDKQHIGQSSSRVSVPLVHGPPSNSSVRWKKLAQEDGKVTLSTADDVRDETKDNSLPADDSGETSTLQGETKPNLIVKLPVAKSDDEGFKPPDLPEEPENLKPLPSPPPSDISTGDVKYERKCDANDGAPVSDRVALAKSQTTSDVCDTDEEKFLKEGKGIKRMEGL